VQEFGMLTARVTRASIVITVTLIVGVVLRLVGLQWGLPQQLHPDEWVIVNGALDLAARHSFEPSLFLRPDHVEIQLSYLAYTAYSIVFVHAPVEVAFAADPGAFRLISRLITVAFGVLMMVFALLIGRRFSPRVGVIALVLVALFAPFVEHSHFATPDVPLTAALMLAVLAGMHYIERPSAGAVLVMSGATAVAIAIKYPGALATAMIAVVIVVQAARDRAWLRIAKHGVLALVAVIGSLFLISPVLFTNARAVVAALTQESRPNDAALGWLGTMAFYASTFATSAGLLVAIALVTGVVAIVRSRSWRALPLALGLIMWAGLSFLSFYWERWGLPMFACALVVAAIGIDWALTRASLFTRWPRRTAALVATVGVLIVANLGSGALAHSVRLASPDTRITSQTLLATKGITADNSIFDGYTPLLPGAPLEMIDEFRVVDHRFEPIDATRRFVVTSNCMSDRYFVPGKYAPEQAFYSSLDTDFTPLATVAFVARVPRSGIELVDTVRSLQEIGAYVAGGEGGCTIRLFTISR